MAIKTLDIQVLEKSAENIYEATVIASKRARQINDETKIELAQRLEPVLLKDVDDESATNQDKLNLSMEFEKKKKPTSQAVEEIVEKKLNFRYRDKS
ncbi:MAG: DNA-directed RNA polymerase subunit omega [Ignavibacteria bacterium]|nr:DNA-directed RNA polymerase subunit omega [Ignavibacteria bacterium]